MIIHKIKYKDIHKIQRLYIFYYFQNVDTILGLKKVHLTVMYIHRLHFKLEGSCIKPTTMYHTNRRIHRLI